MVGVGGEGRVCVRGRGGVCVCVCVRARVGGCVHCQCMRACMRVRIYVCLRVSMSGWWGEGRRAHA